jgi:hypothetical protein
MKGIGGNIKAIIQICTTSKNDICEHVQTWVDAQTVKGWLDLSSGEASYVNYNAKILESTHIFIADYVPLDSRITAETSRMVINGKRFDILLIDNPMELGTGSQLEFYLKFTGGQ